MAAQQNLKNHIRFYPPFHFGIIPLLLLNLIFAICIAVHYWPAYRYINLWTIVMALVFFAMAGVARVGALKVQDRVIRLEERLRLAALLPADQRTHIDELSVRQLIALRFASDAEVPALVHKTLTQNLEPKVIKESIVNWRPDHHRV